MLGNVQTVIQNQQSQPYRYTNRHSRIATPTVTAASLYQPSQPHRYTNRHSRITTPTVTAASLHQPSQPHHYTKHHSRNATTTRDSINTLNVAILFLIQNDNSDDTNQRRKLYSCSDDTSQRRKLYSCSDDTNHVSELHGCRNDNNHVSELYSVMVNYLMIAVRKLEDTMTDRRGS